MPNTKDFIPVQTVKENAVILNDGSVVMIIQTSAVNFDLLSENEQLAIIGSFAALLNSLSFSIQIVIRSKKLDISHYLQSLREAERKQTNPLLQLMMQHYRAFVAAIIRDNEVLDKQFYVVLAVSPIELGMVKSSDAEKSLQKALTILDPRRDHILKQLSRIGLKSAQLDNEKLIRLFYDIYNNEDKISLTDVQGNPANATAVNAPSKFEHGIPQNPNLSASPVQKPPANPSSAPVSAQGMPLRPATPISPPPPPPGPLGPQAEPRTASSAYVTPSGTANAYTQAATPQPPKPPAPAPVHPPQPLPQAGVYRNPDPATKQPPLYSSPQNNNRNPFVVEELPG